MSPRYTEAVQRLLWLGHEGRSLKWDLKNIGAVLERLGHPERKFASIHIAGTNGKGSVATMTASILRAAGHRTGLYTSPHLERMNERIAVNGTAVGDEEFAAAFNAVSETVEALLAEVTLPHHPSYFECLTAMALWHFARAGVETAVLEVGLGGRLDATNVVSPDLTVITAIDFDHERYLGHSIEQIAGEKAGILKPGVPVLSAARHPVARAVVARRAEDVGAPLVDVEAEYRAEEVRPHDLGLHSFVAVGPDGFSMTVAPSMRGVFQVQNALVTVASVQELNRRDWRIPERAVADGIRGAEWPGRVELVRRTPLVFLDGAHNPAGVREVVRFWQDHLPGRRIHLVYGTVRDKAVEELTEALFPLAASVVVTQPSTPRAASAELLASLAQAHGRDVQVEPDPVIAVQSALERAGPEEVVFVTGSLFLVGDCRRWLMESTEEGRASAAAGSTLQAEESF
jgi:dihydrofolate synthase/folylpolyglutamate synthase